MGLKKTSRVLTIVAAASGFLLVEGTPEIAEAQPKVKAPDRAPAKAKAREQRPGRPGGHAREEEEEEAQTRTAPNKKGKGGHIMQEEEEAQARKAPTGRKGQVMMEEKEPQARPAAARQGQPMSRVKSKARRRRTFRDPAKAKGTQAKPRIPTRTPARQR